MFAIIGILVVIGAVMGGYLMEHGQIMVLVQPAELLIIFGAAIGTVLIGNPLPTIIKMIKMLLASLAGSKYKKSFYLENLKMLNDLFVFARKNGLPKLEDDVDDLPQSGRAHRLAVGQAAAVGIDRQPAGRGRRVLLDQLLLRAVLAQAGLGHVVDLGARIGVLELRDLHV